MLEVGDELPVLREIAVTVWRNEPSKGGGIGVALAVQEGNMIHQKLVVIEDTALKSDGYTLACIHMRNDGDGLKEVANDGGGE